MKRLNIATKVLVIVALIIGCVIMINYLRPDMKLIPLKTDSWKGYPTFESPYPPLGDAYK